jgi:glycosyltransferase involved in cell wall biosynthesis
VRPYLAESNAMIVPLRIGGGSRLKILEALATGLPVVSTSVGAEGLELSPGRHYLLGDTDEELAAATLKCLTDPAATGALVDGGRRLVQQRYDWQILAERVHHIWMSLADSAVPCG